MNNLNKEIEEASALIKKAAAFEEAGKLTEALEFYKRGVARFDLICAGYSHARNKYVRDTLVARCADYKTRINAITTKLDAAAQQQLVVTGGGGGNNTNDAQCLATRGPGGGAHGENASSSRYSQQVQNPRVVQWDDIVGLESTKILLQETVILPREMPHLFTGGRKAAQAILLYGAPGNGKTELARALATNAGCAFYTFTPSDIISKFVGESEQNMKLLFETIKCNKPCILFLDEIDALCGKRDGGGGGGSSSGGGGGSQTKTIQEFLIQLDGMCAESMEGVLLLGATNVPWALDSAMLRRMQHRIYVPMPEEAHRRTLFVKLLCRNEHALEAHHFDELAQLTEHYSGADIANLCSVAALAPVRKITKGTRFHAQEAQGLHPVYTQFLVPCDETCARTEHAAIDLRYSEVKQKDLFRAPPIRFTDVLDALHDMQPSVDPLELKRLIEWS